jgi:hypothetical protein
MFSYCIPDPCTDGINTCDKHAMCTPVGSGYKCECKAGYIGNGTYCYLGELCNLILVIVFMQDFNFGPCSLKLEHPDFV